MKLKNVKKYLALILAVVLMVSVFAACGSKDKDSDSGTSGVPSTFKGKLMEPYIKLIVSGKYTYEATQSGGVPVTYAKSGDDRILLTTSVTQDDEKVTLTLMYIDGKYYIVLPSSKSYTEATSSEIKKYKLESLFSGLNLDNFANSTFVKSGKTTYQGTEYQYEDYYSALVQITNRFFFDSDGNLAMVGNVNSKDKVTKPNTIKIYATNSSTFDILSDYTLVEQDSTKSSGSGETTTLV